MYVCASVTGVNVGLGSHARVWMLYATQCVCVYACMRARVKMDGCECALACAHVYKSDGGRGREERSAYGTGLMEAGTMHSPRLPPRNRRTR